MQRGRAGCVAIVGGLSARRRWRGLVSMQIGGRRYQVDWGHLLVVTLVVAVCVWYLFDARSVSLRANNILFVQPASIFAVLLYLLILPQCFRRVPDDPAEAAALAAAEEGESAAPGGVSSLGDLMRVAALAAAFGFFAFSLEIIGFDVATWVFTLIGLFVCGERRLLVLLIFPLVFTAAVILGYQMLVPYPITTTVL
jgi:hypothetical protein